MPAGPLSLAAHALSLVLAGVMISYNGPASNAPGAPNLTDKTWLHGSGEPAIIETVTRGRTGQMPAHKDLLSPSKIHLLTAYIYSLSGGAAEGATTSK